MAIQELNQRPPTCQAGNQGFFYVLQITNIQSIAHGSFIISYYV